MNQAKPIVFLKGARVTLRPILREDIPLIIRWINDPDVWQFLETSMPMMEADENEWFEKLHKIKNTDIVVMIIVDNKPIGIMGIHRINWKDRTASTGALIGEKESWGKGYGTEAKMLLLHYAFNTLNLRKICSSVYAFNKRSHAYLLKSGYVEEGRQRKQIYKKGHYQDVIIMAVFKKDWLPFWRKFRAQS